MTIQYYEDKGRKGFRSGVHHRKPCSVCGKYLTRPYMTQHLKTIHGVEVFRY